MAFHFAAVPTWGMTVLVEQSAVTTGAGSELANLLEAVGAGDHGALKDLYGRTSAKLYGICLRILADPAEAQDVLQDTYVTVWRKAARFDAAKASAITWLSVIARNRSIDRLRGLRAPAAEIEEAVDIPDGNPSALDVIEQAQDADRLSHCLEQIEERVRAMIRAAFFDGLTYGELAAREGVPLGTMKSWIRRGLQRLRGCLEQ